MNRLIPLLAGVLATTALAPVSAQEQPTLFVSSWMCERPALDDLVEMARSRDLPIYQDMTNEGLIGGQMLLVHDWGDEWNYVTITMADDVATGVAASDEFGRRYAERYGDDDGFVDRCPSHRDAIYQAAFSTEPPNGAPMPEPPYSVAMSYFNCPLDKVSDVVAGDRAALLPAAQASINEGNGFWLGSMRHAWADEWSYVIIRSAADLGALAAFNADTNRRVGNARGAPVPTDVCRAHRDNIYQLVYTTQPPSR